MHVGDANGFQSCPQGTLRETLLPADRFATDIAKRIDLFLLQKRDELINGSALVADGEYRVH